ncbi:MAG: hypothetical protein WCO58_01745 [bacterium]
MEAIIIVVIGIILLSWKNLIKMLNIPSVSVSSNTSGIFFGALAYIALLLLLYRVSPKAWEVWYSGGWFWLSQGLIILGIIGIATEKRATGGIILAVGILFAYLDTKSNIEAASKNHKETRYAKHGVWSDGVYLPEWKGVNFLHADADSVLMLTSKNEVIVVTKDAFFYKENHQPFNADKLHCGETRFMAIDGCPETPVVTTWPE